MVIVAARAGWIDCEVQDVQVSSCYDLDEQDLTAVRAVHKCSQYGLIDGYWVKLDSLRLVGV